MLAATQGIIWLEICSPAGVERVALELTPDSTPASQTQGDAHCGYCLLQQLSPILPTTEVQWSPIAVPANQLSLGNGGTTIFKRIVRTAHRTRAPPAFS
jgi:hypothetical protein